MEPSPLELLGQRARPTTLATERALPVLPALVPLLPGGQLARGTTVAVTGVGATSLALGLVAAASTEGSWTVAVGLGDLGLVAAAEAGVALGRLVLVTAPPPDRWATVVATLVETVELVLVRPVGRVADRDALRAGHPPAGPGWGPGPAAGAGLVARAARRGPPGHGRRLAGRGATGPARRGRPAPGSPGRGRGHRSAAGRPPPPGRALAPRRHRRPGLGCRARPPANRQRIAAWTPVRPANRQRIATRRLHQHHHDLGRCRLTPLLPHLRQPGKPWLAGAGCGQERGTGGEPAAAGVCKRAERAVVARIPDWAVVAAGHGGDEPVLVLHANRVVAASAVARAAGVTEGLRRREAQRRCPDAILVPADPARDARMFEPLAGALEAITPRVEVTQPGTVAFGTRGPSRFHGGDGPLGTRIVEVLAGALRTPSPVRVGIADGAFAATCAARPDAGERASGVMRGPDRSVGPGDPAEPPELVVATEGGGPAGAVMVVPPGHAAAFLAPWPVTTAAAHLATPEAEVAADVLRRLGLRTLGAVATLDPTDVLGRFGDPGTLLHRLARGLDPRPLATRRPAPELAVAAEVDPPVERVDHLAFRAVALADDLHARLARDGLACLRLGIEVETEHGEVRRRSWRHEGGLTAAAVAERARWQLDGWLTGPVADRPSAGITRLLLDPEEVVPARGRQLGFWGGETRLDEGAARALARVAALLGTDAVTVPELGGGRGPGDRVTTRPAASVDLGGDRTLVRPDTTGPWPGRLPPPSPALVFADPEPVDLLDTDDRPVRVSGRGLISAAPARLGRHPVVGWAGPWPLVEQWWDPDRARRRARVQVVLGNGAAHLLTLEGGTWHLEGTYD